MLYIQNKTVGYDSHISEDSYSHQRRIKIYVPSFVPSAVILCEKQKYSIHIHCTSSENFHLSSLIDEDVKKKLFLKNKYVKLQDYLIIYAFENSMSELIYALCKIKAFYPCKYKNIKTKSKMAELKDFEDFACYCSKYSVNVKKALQFLLISKIDNVSKIINYRTAKQITELLELAIKIIIENSHCVIISSNSQNNAPLNSETTEFIEILEMRMKQQKQYTVEIFYNSTNKKIYFINNEKGSYIVKLISENYLKNHFTFFHQRLSNKMVLYTKILLSNSAIVKCLSFFTNKMITQTIQRIRNTEIIQKYFVSFIYSKKHCGLVKGRSTYIINMYFSTFAERRKTVKKLKETHTVTLYKFFQSIKQSSEFYKKFMAQQIVKVQNVCRMFLTVKKMEYMENENFLSKQRQIYSNNQKEYYKLVHSINKSLSEKDGYLSTGIHCQLSLIHVNSWSNCEKFSPSNLSLFFQNALPPGFAMLKISVQGSLITIVRSDGRVFSYGLSEPEDEAPCSKKFSCDHSLMTDSKGYLFAKGDNQQGQLGIGSELNFKTEWTKVKLKSKAKSFHCQSYRSICLTENNYVYIWGRLSSGVSNIPKLCKFPSFANKNFVSVVCSFSGYFALTSDSEILNAYNGQMTKRIFNNAQTNAKFNDKMLLYVGNSAIYFVYFVGLSIQCYDLAKKKTILKWFRNMYKKTESRNEDELLCTYTYRTAQYEYQSAYAQLSNSNVNIAKEYTSKASNKMDDSKYSKYFDNIENESLFSNEAHNSLKTSKSTVYSSKR